VGHETGADCAIGRSDRGMHDPSNPSGAIHIAGGHVPNDHDCRVANEFCANGATEFNATNRYSDRCASRPVLRQ